MELNILMSKINNNSKNSWVRYLDKLKWVSIYFIAIFGIVENIYYGRISSYINSIIFFFVLPLIIYIGLTTKKGRLIQLFFKNTRTEIYKIIWPTKEEIFQTILLVIIFVSIMSLIIWGIDTLFMFLISKIFYNNGVI